MIWLKHSFQPRRCPSIELAMNRCCTSTSTSIYYCSCSLDASFRLQTAERFDLLLRCLLLFSTNQRIVLLRYVMHLRVSSCACLTILAYEAPGDKRKIEGKQVLYGVLYCTSTCCFEDLSSKESYLYSSKEPATCYRTQ